MLLMGMPHAFCPLSRIMQFIGFAVAEEHNADFFTPTAGPVYAAPRFYILIVAKNILILQ